MNDRAIWYITFQSPALSGSGLATYCREVIKAAESQNREVRFYYVDPKATERSEQTVGLVSIVTVPGVPEPAYRNFGPIMYQSLAVAHAVLADLQKGMRPIGIECPDGYALGYYLLQHKRTLNQALADIPITVVAHTPIAVIDDWIGLEPYRSPEWWMYRAEKWCFLACDAVVTYSDMLENQLRSRGYLPSHVKVTRRPNPFSMQDAAELAGQNAPRSLVVMASQMLNWKGLPHALSLAHALEESKSPLTVELLGPNPTLPGQSASQVDLMKADHPHIFATKRIKYKGTLTHEELMEQRRSWYCQIHPSKYDNFPYSVLECLAQGTPCLMTSGNGVSECLSVELFAALVVDFDNPLDVISKLENLPNPKALKNGIDWGSFDAKNYFDRCDSIFDNLATRTQRSRQFPFIQQSAAKQICNPALASDMSIRSRVSFASDSNESEFVTLSQSSLSDEFIFASIAVLDHYDNVGFVGCWAREVCTDAEDGASILPNYNAEPMPSIIMDQPGSALLVRRQVWDQINLKETKFDPSFQNWNKLLSLLENGLFGVILPSPLHNADAHLKTPDPVTWRRNFSQLVEEHKQLFSDNIVDFNGFLSANGTDAAYQLATRERSLFKKPKVQGRLKPLHRIARSLSRKLSKFAEKGAR